MTFQGVGRCLQGWLTPRKEKALELIQAGFDSVLQVGELKGRHRRSKRGKIGRERSAEALSLLLQIGLGLLQLVMERQQGESAASQALLEGVRHLIPSLGEDVLELA